MTNVFYRCSSDVSDIVSVCSGQWENYRKSTNVLACPRKGPDKAGR
jgi:hypothetical protein